MAGCRGWLITLPSFCFRRERILDIPSVSSLDTRSVLGMPGTWWARQRLRTGDVRLGNDPRAGRPGGAHPTMRDVAVLAGVGVMTVSRVVNGRGGVGPERAARVRQAIEKLDYRHNVTARHLRLTGQSTATIGVLLEDVANPFLAELLRAVQNVMSEQDCLVLCASSDGDAAREKALLGAFCARPVHGLIIVPPAPHPPYLLPEFPPPPPA